MKMLIGIALTLIGGAVILYGGGAAVKELAGMYSQAMDAPLKDPEGGEQGVASRMKRGVIIGAVGVPPFLVGIALMKGAAVARLIRASRESKARAQAPK